MTSFPNGSRGWAALAGAVLLAAGAAAQAADRSAAALPPLAAAGDLPQPQHPVPVTAIAASPTADYWVAAGHRQLRFVAAGQPLCRRPGYEPVAARDLLAHWDFETGGLPTTDGPRGKAFRPTTDCPDVQLHQAVARRPRPLDRYTLAVWLRVESRGGVLYGDNSRQIRLTPGREETGVELTIRDGKQVSKTGIVGKVPTGVWTHLAVTVDRNQVQCFVNGEPAGEGTFNGLRAAILKPGNIGGIYGNGGSRLFGESALDDLRWYDRVLTAEEIGAIVQEIEAPYEVVGGLPFAGGTLHDLRFSRDGRRLLAAGGRGADSGMVQVYDLADGSVWQTLEAYEDVFLSADLAADERWLATGGPSKLVTVYDLQAEEKPRQISGHTDWVTEVCFSPDGRLLASGDRSGGLSVWESETGSIVFGLPGHKAAISQLVWLPDGSRLTSVSEDGRLIAWNMQDGFKLFEATAHEKKVLDRWSRYTGVTAAGLVPGGEAATLFTTGRDRCLRLWGDGEKPVTEICELGFLPTAAAASRDGLAIFAGDRDGQLHVIDLRSQRSSLVSAAAD